ncbi:hypothetical protein GOP47_0011336 [Adiantum capillus-veneris]|uniref:Trichome birefringence-like N-terminal domain-containing protein n=1 Tax=Adiantum capillus-veneris TaxID=13818 RepID=A0A9D4UU16_ADICA|nr:hypothetical protein GOP47_0011336 [Adiantum capillus-veneris]
MAAAASLHLWNGWRRTVSSGRAIFKNGRRADRKRVTSIRPSAAAAGRRCMSISGSRERWRGRWNAVLLAVCLVTSSCVLVFLGSMEQFDHHHRLQLKMSLSGLRSFHDSVRHLITQKTGAACDYSRGVWVHTRRKLLYTGNGCQRWLSPMWACRLHSNRSFLYESLHWQPHSCTLPPFHPPTFLQRMENRTIAFIGDSLGRQQFQSLMCLLTQGKDDYDNVLDVGAQFGFPPYVKSNKLNNTKAIRPSSWAYRFEKTKTTILFSWSPTLCHIESLPTNGTNLSISTSASSNFNIDSQMLDVAFHLDHPPSFLSSNLDKLDVIILNTGPHWTLNKFTRNRWKPYLEQKPLDINMTKDSIATLYNVAISKLRDWLDLQAKSGATTATIFYRTLSPHHFFGGEWNSGGRCDNIHYRFMNSISIRNLSSPSHLDVVEDMLGRHNTTIKLLNITWLSQLRDEAHISKSTLKGKNGTQDCLHWCLPGVPDTWNEILYAQLLQATSK